jgi:hypothetical protein
MCKNSIESIKCSKCNESMPKLRKELYGYDFCVKCSSVLPKVGRVVTYGQGEDTWNDLEIMDQDTARRILELEQISNSKNLDDLDILDYNQDGQDNPGEKYIARDAMNDIVNKFDFESIPDSSIIFDDEVDSELDLDELDDDLLDI